MTEQDPILDRLHHLKQNPQERIPLRVTTNNVFLREGVVTYPAIIDHIETQVDDEGSVELATARFYILDGNDAIIPFTAVRGNRDNTHPRRITSLAPLES